MNLTSGTIGQPEPLFDGTQLNITLTPAENRRNFDVAHDGSIIAIQNLPPTRRQVVLVQNWIEEFR